MSNKLILAIDTSCDETSVAVTRGRQVLSNVLASQVEIHRKYGGVYPSEAKRLHREKIEPVTKEALARARVGMKDVEVIAVTVGPGLAPALEVGVEWAKKLAEEFRVPLVAVNHLEGHLLSVLAQNSKGKGAVEFDILNQSNYPVLGILVSGGHTELVKVEKIGRYRVIGRTLDDAAGECLDKVGRMLGLAYPAGEVVEKLAKFGEEDLVHLPLPMMNKPGLEMSFSGLKTAALYQIESQVGGQNWQREGHDQLQVRKIRTDQVEGLSRRFICNMCAEVQSAVVAVVIAKAQRAVRQIGARSVWLGGGVAANLKLRRRLRQVLRREEVRLYQPYNRRLCTDNAAMIGVAAGFKFERGETVTDMAGLERQPRFGL